MSQKIVYSIDNFFYLMYNIAKIAKKLSRNHNMKKYYKNCIEKNPIFSVYHGAGNYISSEQNAVLHYDTELTVSYFKQCDGVIKIEGKCYDLHNGDIVIMNPNEIHCCLIKDETFHERISLCINMSILNGFPFDFEKICQCFYKRENGIGNVISSDTVPTHCIAELAEDILSLSESKNEKNKILCTCKIIELLIQLSDILAVQSETPMAFSSENPLIRQVIQYISEHIATLTNCNQIAKEFFVSKHRLEHLFKECVGIPMWEYVILRRLMLFNDFIQQGKNVKEAAFMSGFKNYSNFYRLYKKHMNIIPLEYKRTLKSPSEK